VDQRNAKVLSLEAEDFVDVVEHRSFRPADAVPIDPQRRVVLADPSAIRLRGLSRRRGAFARMLPATGGGRGETKEEKMRD
jgi:hypothetical protein